MDTTDIERILTLVSEGSLTPQDASDQLARLPFSDLGVARIDHHRSLRQGFPEAVYAPGKSLDDINIIVDDLLGHGTGSVIITRATPAQVEACEKIGLAHGLDAVVTEGPDVSTVVFRPAPDLGHRIIVVTAGTADAPVADECAAVLRGVGLDPQLLRDRGVAGLHRILGDIDTLSGADAIVVVAGMEGALASVVGGLARGPVIAVPTSVGYGSSLEGVTALLAMMASCAAGVSVVGIDNGFGAAFAVLRAIGSRS